MGVPADSARALLALMALAAVQSACVEPDSYDDRDGYGPRPLGDVAELTIDAGEGLVLDPGEGIGVGVEYGGDGRWALTLVCDTNLSGAACFFDVLITSDGSSQGVDDVTASDLESGDEVFSPDPFAVELRAATDTATDGVTFTTSPGATVRLSALLYDPVLGSDVDWNDDPRVISWVGSGAIHRGAPTNPVDLTPNRP
jgi:hypothetical protein